MKRYTAYVSFFSFLTLFGILSGNAYCATFFVATNGSDANQCSLNSPCATVNKALTHCSAGDVVEVRGGTYSGNEVQRIVVDRDNVTIKAYPGETPVFDAQNNYPTTKAEIKANFRVGYFVSEGALDIGGHHDVTIDGLTFQNYTGQGIRIWNGSYNVTIKNTKVITTWWTSFLVTGEAHDILMEDSELEGGQAYAYFIGNGDYKAGIGYNQGASVSINNASKVTMRRCIVRDSGAEGLDLDRYSYNCVVEYSQLYGNRKGNIYLCSGDGHIVRYNLIYGTAVNAYGYPANGRGICGISVVNEDWPKLMSGGHYQIYGNLVADCYYNLYMNCQVGWELTGVYIYNNTFVAPTGSWNVLMGANTTPTQYFYNNIISGKGSSGTGYARPGVVIAANNLWSSSPVDSLKGANDPPYSDPMIAKTQGWNNLRGGELTGKEFALQSGSPAIDAGKVVEGGSYQIMDCSQSDWLEQVFVPKNIGDKPVIGGDYYDSNTGLSLEPSPPYDLQVVSN